MLNYALMAPSIMPLAKCFCRKGYTHIMGSMVMITAHILMPMEKVHRKH